MANRKKPKHPVPAPPPTIHSGHIDNVSIRMYCMGTGDCFLLRFHSGEKPVFTMMIDCGSCKGNREDFLPYVTDLAASLTDKTIDLLVITHEHNDHVNGFDKCIDVFEPLTIREAWFAWTENPVDPGGAAAALKTRQSNMKKGLRNAINAIAGSKAAKTSAGSAFLNGLNTLAEINLNDDDQANDGPGPLPGMKKIKDLLQRKKVPTRYLNPGETASIPALQGLRFYVLGPPSDQQYIYTDGKLGSDVFNKNLALNDSSLAVNALLALSADGPKKDIPFSASYLLEQDPPVKKAGNKKNISAGTDLATRVNPLTKADPAAREKTQTLIDAYYNAENDWRTIDTDWLTGAGALALRLNSHINNTSLVLAIESEKSEKVLLFPGDAEFGSWESWHLIKEWTEKGKEKTTWARDLLRRTVFYKVGHHCSYNGTALELGIRMMTSPELAAMATLDRHRIAKAWTSTMPNKLLLQELVRRTRGKCFLMDEFEIDNAPTQTLNPSSLGTTVYKTGSSSDGKKILYKEYTVSGL